MKEEIDYNSNEIKKWALFAGLNGGFAGGTFQTFEESSAKDAYQYCYQLAIDEYDSYVGMHGLRTVSEIMEEDEVDEEEAEQLFNDEREGWLDYYIEEYNPIKHEQYED